MQAIPDWVGKKRIMNTFFVGRKDEVIKWEVLTIKSKQLIKVRFISVNSDNRQGIRLAIDAGEGKLTINGLSGKCFELWKDECPYETEIECFSDEGFLSVYNIFEKQSWTGRKEKYSQMDYSGMILEKKDNIYRYRCNNATLESEFEEMVFEIELL
jgi:hypothetical protein